MARRLNLIVPMLLLLLGLALRTADPPVLADLRLKVFDFYQALKPRAFDPALPVRIVDVDDESLSRHGQWPWPRVLLAELVERLAAQGTAVIAFDIVFAEPDRTSPRRLSRLWAGQAELDAWVKAAESLPDHDEVFAQAIGKAVVVTSFAGTESGGRAPSHKSGFAFAGDDPVEFLPAYSGAVVNLPAIEAAGTGNGGLNYAPDRDNVVRGLPLLISYRGDVFPHIVAEVLRVAQGASTYIVKASGSSGETGFGESTGITQVKVGRLVVPTDRGGRVLLYDTGHRPERTIPAWQVLAGAVPPEALADTIVLIGSSAALLKDQRATPLDSVVAGVEINAQIIEQILLQNFLARPDWAEGAEILYLLVLGGLLILIIPKIGAAWGALLSAGAVAIALALSWHAFANLQLLFAPLYPSIIVVLVYISSAVISYLRSEAERNQVRGAFSRYMSPVLVEQLAREPGRLKLGGEMREMTLLFCDIRGFTTISEQFDAEGLTGLINRFLTPMTEVILEGQGTIDKYMGDCIMAFWNAPLDDRDHAAHACQAALAMRARLVRLNDELLAEAGAEGRSPVVIQIGIGLNTGVCCVGNMGSEQRFDYSALGDDVNLASRLEGQSKTYGVDIVIGDATHELAPEFAVLELDLIRVKGKRRPVRIHALLGDRAVAEAPEFLALRAAHDEMIAGYRQRAWTCVRDRLAACRVLGAPYRLDGLYELYESRCDAYLLDPPAPDWDGVYVALTK